MFPVSPGSAPAGPDINPATGEAHRGLGLSILRDIAEKHGGTMEIESGEDGFRIRMAIGAGDVGKE